MQISEQEIKAKDLVPLVVGGDLIHVTREQAEEIMKEQKEWLAKDSATASE